MTDMNTIGEQLRQFIEQYEHLESEKKDIAEQKQRNMKGNAVKTPHIGKKCIIRTYASGVHFGTLVDQDGRQVELSDARRLWRWHTGGEGISLSEIATTGIDQSRSRIAVTVPAMTILDALEIIPATDAAAASIETAGVAK